MDLLTLTVLSFGVAMDAFAASVCKGLALKKPSLKQMTVIGLWMGSFQAAMPIIGYLLGFGFQNIIAAVDHWIAMVLLTVIGVNMIRESLKKESESLNDNLGFKEMFAMATATSIDALALGITFAFLQVNILTAATLFGVITFLVVCVGVWIGSAVGEKHRAKAEFAGGLVLIAMGIKILAEHLLG